MTQQDNARRITALEVKIDAMRGDVSKLESSADRVETAVQAIQLQLAALKPRSLWPQILAYAGVMVPLYVLVIDLVARGLR